MRKNGVYTILLVAALILGNLFFGIPAYAATTQTKTREINIVYDDSGSMAATYQNSSPVASETKWSQAKYALKVFTAMMGESDTANIYPMSGNKNGKQSGIVRVAGTMSANERVKEVSKINTGKTSDTTPFATVQAAGNDLKNSDADERWLIILTDGIFQEYDDDETRAALKVYADDTSMKVAYIGIGENVVDMSQLDNETFFSYNGITEDKILSTVTEVARKVYNYQALQLDSDKNSVYRFTTDIPISKIVIFAQGKDISVGELQLEDNKVETKPEDVAVNVLKGNEKAPTVEGWSDIQFASGLEGHIISYTAAELPFGNAEGMSTYSFSCNTSNVEVYFEPGIEVQMILKDSTGENNIVSQSQEISVEAGEFEADFQMVNPLNGDVINQGSSELLGTVDLSASLSGTSEMSAVQAGDKVQLEEGSYIVTTTAKFEDGREENDKSTVKVSPATYKITFSEESYTIDVATLKCSESIGFTITNKDGSPAEIPVEKISVADVNGLKFKISDQGKGIYNLEPEYAGENISDVHSGKEKLTVVVVDNEQQLASGGTNIIISADEQVQLVINLEMPDEKYPSQDPKYMFNPNILGENEQANYITAKVQAVDATGTVRNLTDGEWKQGQKCFDFQVISNDGNFIYQHVIKTLLHQKIDFDVQLGEAASSYKLYLDGTNPIKILPNTSHIQMTQHIQLENGVIEEGTTEGSVSIQSLGMIMYLKKVLLILLIIMIILIILCLYCRKPKFKRDMKPNVIIKSHKNGIDMPVREVICKYTVRNRLSLLRPERMKIEINSLGKLDYMSLDCVATGKGKFCINNPSVFRRYAQDIRVDQYDYEALEKKKPELTSDFSTIRINFNRLNEEGIVIIYFIKRRTISRGGR